MSSSKIDVKVVWHGSVASLEPMTKAAKQWMDENLRVEGWQWLGNMLCIEPRYADEIAGGMQAAGLVVA